MNTLLIFALAGLGTYLLRVSMIFAPAELLGSGWLQERIGLLSPAVLAAIVASALFVTGGAVVAPNLVEIVAVAAAMAAVIRSGNVSHALLVGLPVYWVGAVLGLT